MNEAKTKNFDGIVLQVTKTKNGNIKNSSAPTKKNLKPKALAKVVEAHSLDEEDTICEYL